MKVFFYTSRGLLPHLSQRVPDSVHVSLPHIYHLKTILRDMNFVTYFGLTGVDTLLSIKDTLHPKCIAGNADFERIRIICQDEASVTVEEYMKFAAKAGFSHVVSFSEEASSASGHHRAQRSAKQAAETVAKCVEMKAEGMKIYGNIQGGKSIGDRMRCAKYMKTTNVDGFYIGGMYAEDDPSVVRDIIQFVCAELRGEERPIILSGMGRAVDIVVGAMEGITLFETASPFDMAQKGLAMTLPIPDDLPCLEGPVVEIDLAADYKEPTINLKEDQYVKDVQPILQNCQCYACLHHSKAYIRHLLACEELTGTALVTL